MVKNNETGNWYTIRDFKESNTCMWYTNGIGNKTLYVEVKDELGNVIKKSLDYTIKEPEINIESFTTDKQSPQKSKETIKLNVEATGTGVLQYKFLVKNNETGNWYTIRDFEKSNTCTWYTNATGNKTLYVYVKDELGNIIKKSLDYIIEEK